MYKVRALLVINLFVVSVDDRSPAIEVYPDIRSSEISSGSNAVHQNSLIAVAVVC